MRKKYASFHHGKKFHSDYTNGFYQGGHRKGYHGSHHYHCYGENFSERPSSTFRETFHHYHYSRENTNKNTPPSQGPAPTFWLKVDPSKCTGCGICVRTCPMHVFELRRIMDKKQGNETSSSTKNQSRSFIVNEVNCIHCGKCIRKCPQQAINQRVD